MFELRSCHALPIFGLVHAVIICATSRKSAESSFQRAVSPQMFPHPWTSRQLGTWSVRVARRCRLRTSQVAAQVSIGLVRACCANRMMACLTPSCCLHLQVDAALSAEQLRQSLQAAFQQKQWQWTYLLRMAMASMPATLGRSDDLRKLPWSCLALRTQDNVGPVPSVATLFSSMQGKTVKPGQVDIPGVVRYAHSCCQTQ